MDKTKILEGLKMLKEAFMKAKETFKDVKLKDGVTIFRYDGDMPAVGMEVVVVTADGALPAPDGDYEFEDGTKVNIAGGLIASVTPAAAPADPNAPPTPAAMTEAQAKSVIESVITERHYINQETFDAKFVELEKEKETFETAKKETETKIAGLEKEVEKLTLNFKSALDLIEKIAELPSAPAADPKKPFNLSQFKSDFKKDLEELHYKKED